jgi:GTP-binding protein HflX
MRSLRETSVAERALLVGVGWKRAARIPGVSASEPGRESLAELEELARSAGAEIAGSVFQMRDAPDPATLVGRGKLEEVRIEAEMRHAPLIIFDRNLSPVQQRNIERATACRVIDRTQLILDIFARHARSREGQLQIELAQLNYMAPRITGRGAEMSRLGGRSGGGSAGGRIGVRGPGEQKLETDRRRIRDRVSKIQRGIEAIRKQRSLRRESRQAVPLGTVALVGYTNAGKSTLFNALSRADVLVSSKMFATLDPTIRAVRLPSHRRVLISDTVGFIRDLPKPLLTAFRATLEEVQEAALILHVSDISNPQQAELDSEVEKILRDLGVEATPRLRVFNKVDRFSPGQLAAFGAADKFSPKLSSGSPDDPIQSPAERRNGAVFVSALTGAGLEELLLRIDQAMPLEPAVRMTFSVPLSDGRTLALVHALGRVLHSEVRGSQMNFEADVPVSVARNLKLKTNLSI